MGNKKGFVIIIIILVLIIIGLAGFIGFDKFMLKKEESKTITVINDKEINLNSFYQISDIMNDFDNAFNDSNSTYLGYPYVKKKLSASNFDFNAALYVSAYKELLPTNGMVRFIHEGVVRDNFEKIFGKQLKYEGQSIDAGETYKLMYSADTSTYSYALVASKFAYSPTYICKNIKTRLEEEKIIVTRKVFFVEYELSPETGLPISANVYQDSSKAVNIGQIALRNGTLSINEIIGKYGSKISEYDMTFKHIKDEDYEFYMIEKTK